MNFQFQSLAEWGFRSSHPFVVSGPCGIETEEQIHATAQAMNNGLVHLLRGGIWKPRTRPDSFQGIGKEGLKWLKDAGIENKLPVTVEVASPKHIEEALSAGIDVLWIGARTTVNPFLIQEIADALKGIDIPVMIKNPINPELELWIGAIERIYNSGIHRLAAVHRGFSTYEKTKYRNIPNWQIPIELKRRYPDLPLICDPSHICGQKEMIQAVAQTALDLNYNGLMIETHIDPEIALSDKQQQLTPAALVELLQSLVIRKPSTDDIIFINLLEELRDKIDLVDGEILSLISDRMGIARDIGRYKKENNMTILQEKRWKEIMTTRLQFGLNKDLTSEFIVKLYELIHDESIHQQMRVMNSIDLEKENINHP